MEMLPTLGEQFSLVLKTPDSLLNASPADSQELGYVHLGFTLIEQGLEPVLMLRKAH